MLGTSASERVRGNARGYGHILVVCAAIGSPEANNDWLFDGQVAYGDFEVRQVFGETALNLQRVCEESVRRECAKRVCEESVRRECAKRVCEENVRRECAKR